jgi:hypothetical protein
LSGPDGQRRAPCAHSIDGRPSAVAGGDPKLPRSTAPADHSNNIFKKLYKNYIIVNHPGIIAYINPKKKQKKTNQNLFTSSKDSGI